MLSTLADINLEPSNIDTSAEGGICISFRRGDRYGDVEFLNSGEVLAVTSLGGCDTRVWETDAGQQDLRRTVNLIRGFIGC